AQLLDSAAAHEYEAPARSQQPGSFGDPALWIAPDRRAELRESEIEGRVGERHVLGARLHQRKLESVLLLHPPCGVELGGRDVHAAGSSARPGEPRREIRGAAAELDDVEAGDVAEDAQLRLAPFERAPDDLPASPLVLGVGIVELGIRARPVRPVDLYVLR